MSAVEVYLSIHDVRDVAPLAEKLHHLLARPRHLRPSGFRLGVLLKSSNLVTIKYEVHLPQAALGSPSHGELCSVFRGHSWTGVL